MGDAASVQDFFGQDLLGLFLDILLAAAAFVFLATIHLPLLLISIAHSPPALFGVSAIANRIKEYTRKSRECVGQANTVVQDTVGGMAMVKAFNLQAYFLERYRAHRLEELRYILKRMRIEVLTSPLHVTLRMLPNVICATCGGYLAVSGRLTPGELLAFLYLLGYISWPLAFLTDKIKQVKAAAGATQKVLEILDTPGERTGGGPLPAPARAPAVSSEDVAFAYQEGTQILAGLSFSVRPGEKDALVGPSGCGKSTVLKLICGFHAPAAGRVLLDGQDLAGADLTSLRGMLSLVTQETFLYPVSVRENIAYGRPEATVDQIAAAAKAASAYDFIMALPEGFATTVGERGAKLSGGQKQRLALALAVLKDASLLLLDEPTSALDTESEAAIQEALARITPGKTAIVVAHRFSTIKHVDRILAMDQGRIVEAGTHEELLRLGGLYRRLYEKQLTGREDPGDAQAVS